MSVITHYARNVLFKSWTKKLATKQTIWNKKKHSPIPKRTNIIPHLIQNYNSTLYFLFPVCYRFLRLLGAAISIHLPGEAGERGEGCRSEVVGVSRHCLKWLSRVYSSPSSEERWMDGFTMPSSGYCAVLCSYGAVLMWVWDGICKLWSWAQILQD